MPHHDPDQGGAEREPGDEHGDDGHLVMAGAVRARHDNEREHRAGEEVPECELANSIRNLRDIRAGVKNTAAPPHLR